jgi:hypothetical protein
VSGFLFPLLLGLLLGARHAFEPDHLATVAALLGGGGSRSDGRRAVRIGVLWGAGHAIALLAAGSAVIFLGWRVPPRMQGILDGAVALALVGMGCAILIRIARGDRAHLHWHEHDGYPHAHLHFHGEDRRLHHHHPLPALHDPARRPILLGMLHGLSGSGAASMLVLAAAESPAAALGSLVLFGAGALGGMAGLSRILSWPLERAERRSSSLYAWLRLTTGFASLAFGLLIGARVLSWIG